MKNMWAERVRADTQRRYRRAEEDQRLAQYLRKVRDTGQREQLDEPTAKQLISLAFRGKVPAYHLVNILSHPELSEELLLRVAKRDQIAGEVLDGLLAHPNCTRRVELMVVRQLFSSGGAFRVRQYLGYGYTKVKRFTLAEDEVLIAQELSRHWRTGGHDEWLHLAEKATTGSEADREVLKVLLDDMPHALPGDKLEVRRHLRKLVKSTRGM